MVPAAPLFGWETVLVVEPHDAVRALAVIVLQTHGYRVLESRTAAEAEAVLEQHQGAVDLLVLGLSELGPAAELAGGPVPRDLRFKVLNWAAAAEAVQPQARTASGVACFGPLSLARKIRDVLSEPTERNLPSQRQIG
jgi:CheY-like chemotaxis protein